MANDYYKSKERRLSEIAIYLLAKLEQQCADFARSEGISEGELTRRVSELLQAQAGGQPLGSADMVPHMREVSGGIDRGRETRRRTVEPLALHAPAQSNGASIGRGQHAPAPSTLQAVLALKQEDFSNQEIAAKLGQKPGSIATAVSHLRNMGYDIPRATSKGFKYEGTHWMQQPENLDRMRRMNRGRLRKGNRKKGHRGQWTQNPKNRKRMKAALAKARAAKAAKPRPRHRRGQPLTPRMAEAWQLHKSGLNYQLIAEKMGITPTGASVFLSAARQRLGETA